MTGREILHLSVKMGHIPAVFPPFQFTEFLVLLEQLARCRLQICSGLGIGTIGKELCPSCCARNTDCRYEAKLEAIDKDISPAHC